VKFRIGDHLAEMTPKLDLDTPEGVSDSRR